MLAKEGISFHTQITPPIQITDYIIGSNLLANLHQLSEINSKNYSSFLILSDIPVYKLYGKKVSRSLQKLGVPVTSSIIKPGEKQKTLSTISHIVMPYFQHGFNRNACLIALGGGVISDLGGFIASIMLRGIATIYLPTSLVGQIDAGLGGKTGVDIMLKQGLLVTNMLGTITQPKTVISDVDALLTLPEREILNGLGELVKYWVGWGRPSFQKILEFKKERDKPVLTEIVRECQKIKMEIVQKDPYEKTGLRQKLNLGHTFGRAIEAAAGGKLSHGQAVSIGLAAVAKLSVMKNMLSNEIFEKIISRLVDLGLPIRVPKEIDFISTSDILKALSLDKKGGSFVLIEDIGKLRVGVKVEPALIKKLLEEIIV